jgi:cytochrome o ubiquinol oxidase subunit 3
MNEVVLNQHADDHHKEHLNNLSFGFWIYLMTDLIMFACLFAAYAVLKDSTWGGSSGKELFSLPFVLGETLILLTSSFTCGLAMIGVHSGNKKQTLMFLSLTALLGLSFLGFEFTEFSHLLSEGDGPDKSAFLSSFFSLVGTHGMHILVGLLWLFVAVFAISKRGITEKIKNQLFRFSLFWHFLDIVWIFIFTFVYLMSKT